MAPSRTTTEAVETGEWGAHVDPREYLYDDPNFGYGLAPASVISDREEGRNRPIFQTEQELAIFRGQARLIFDATPVANSAVENVINYVNGPGFTYTAKSRKGVKAPVELVEQVQRVVDLFLERADWPADGEREAIRRDRRDGDLFMGLWHVGRGIADLRFIEPEQVVEPGNPQDIEEAYSLSSGCWTFGVHSDYGDTETVYGFNVKWSESDGDAEYLPEWQVEHGKRNVDRKIKRGLSDFYLIKQELLREDILRENLAVGAALQAAIAWILQPPETASGEAVTSLLGSISTGTVQQQRVDGAGTQTQNASKYPAGTILVPKGGLRYEPGPMGAERNPGLMLVAEYLLRSIGIRWQMPEYMISGDASNANYSSTLVAESPFVKAREADQRFYKKRFTRLIWKVVRIAYEAGWFHGYGVTWGQLRSLVDVEIGVPAVASRDPKAVRDYLAIEQAMGITSDRTIAAELGRDLDTEKQQKAEDGDPVRLPPAMPGASGAMLPQPSPSGAEPQTAAPAEFGDISRLQWTRNVKAIKGVLAEYGEGDMSDVLAVELLTSLGLTEERAKRLLGTKQPEAPPAADTAESADGESWWQRWAKSWRSY